MARVTQPDTSNRLMPLGRAPWPVLVVVAFLLVAAVLLAQDHWRRGSLVIGGGALAAGVLRLLLPAARAGVLAVRSKPFDVGSYALLGGTIMVIAGTINPLGIS